MAHWDHRDEPGFAKFGFSQPYAKGLQRLKDEVLGRTDFDPAVLWQWGTMQAMAVIQVLKDCEAAFGAEGQQVVYQALHKVGYDVARQVVSGHPIPLEGLSEAEHLSYFATVINRIAYASLEKPRIDSADQVSFDILWCPHQDHYRAFDCRVQRYFVQGMLDALLDHARQQLGEEAAERYRFEVRFDSTIPAGAPTCHFTIWKGTEEERDAWTRTTELINQKALEHARTKRAR